MPRSDQALWAQVSPPSSWPWIPMTSSPEIRSAKPNSNDSNLSTTPCSLGSTLQFPPPIPRAHPPRPSPAPSRRPPTPHPAALWTRGSSWSCAKKASKPGGGGNLQVTRRQPGYPGAPATRAGTAESWSGVKGATRHKSCRISPKMHAPQMAMLSNFRACTPHVSLLNGQI